MRNPSAAYKHFQNPDTCKCVSGLGDEPLISKDPNMWHVTLFDDQFHALASVEGSVPHSAQMFTLFHSQNAWKLAKLVSILFATASQLCAGLVCNLERKHSSGLNAPALSILN